MNRASHAPTLAASKRGQALVVVVVMMGVLLGIGALAVDLGYLYVTRNELQDVADGAALAGARMLGHIYQGIPQQNQATFVCASGSGCSDSIIGVAQSVASQNSAGAMVMSVPTEDVAIGKWDGNAFTPADTFPDAVQVISRRDEVANGPVGMFFAKTLGFLTGSVNAIAVAALTGQGTATPGEVELPIGISRYFFDQNPDGGFCHENITFYPSNDPSSCAGWTSWDYGSNDATLRKILEEDPSYPSPGVITNQTIFNFTGGTLSNPTFDALLDLFQTHGSDTDANYNYLLDASGNRVNQATLGTAYTSVNPDGTVNNPAYAVALTDPDGVQQYYTDGTTARHLHRWDTTVPVYDRGDCTNPNQSILIVGFANVELTDVLNAPDKYVAGTVECNLVSPEDNRGGGGNYGIRGSIPGLVR